jgi:hypothetical protein
MPFFNPVHSPAWHASRPAAQRKLLRASAPLRENRLFLFSIPISTLRSTTCFHAVEVPDFWVPFSSAALCASVVKAVLPTLLSGTRREIHAKPFSGFIATSRPESGNLNFHGMETFSPNFPQHGKSYPRYGNFFPHRGSSGFSTEGDGRARKQTGKCYNARTDPYVLPCPSGACVSCAFCAFCVKWLFDLGCS